MSMLLLGLSIIVKGQYFPSKGRRNKPHKISHKFGKTWGGSFSLNGEYYEMKEMTEIYYGVFD